MELTRFYRGPYGITTLEAFIVGLSWHQNSRGILIMKLLDSELMWRHFNCKL